MQDFPKESELSDFSTMELLAELVKRRTPIELIEECLLKHPDIAFAVLTKAKDHEADKQV